ncbi:MAG: arginine deiminase family protein [Candidatus Thorarchaeota archaeon]
MTIPKRAIVRPPGRSFCNCISSHPQHDTIDLNKAFEQHKLYTETLEDIGLEIIPMAPQDELPDSCFVEDTAVIHEGKAFISRMGAEPRHSEVESIELMLGDYLKVERAKEPATVEGGDVIHLEERLICGVTQRTNYDGITQMTEFLDTEILGIPDPSIVHLKSYITYLGRNTMLATKTYADHPILMELGYDMLRVDDQESYAANSLTVHGTVLLPSGYPKTLEMLQRASFDVVTLDMSEFMKCEGALTCLSLIF